jgi:hypothetical protein
MRMRIVMAHLLRPILPRGCVGYVSTIRDVSSHRHQTGRPAAFPDGYGLGTRPRTDGPVRDEDGWTGAAPPTVTSPGVPERNECTCTRIVSCPPSLIDGYGGRELMRLGAVTNLCSLVFVTDLL